MLKFCVFLFTFCVMKFKTLIQILLVLLVATVLTIFGFYSSGDKKEDSELLLVHVVFRHGERTPSSFYPNDPNKNFSFYPFGFGQLTNGGKKGEYELGKLLRREYDQFLGEDYTDGIVYARSTDFTRTRMSALLVLAGLFPPSQKLIWNDALLWQPIPVDYVPYSKEDLLHPEASCPFKAKFLDGQPNIKEAREKFIDPYRSILKILSDKSGMEILSPTQVQTLYLIISCEKDLGLIIPDWAETIYTDLQRVAGLAYPYQNFDPKIRTINVGYLIDKIIKDTEGKIANTLKPQNRKIFLYSGHESTVGYLLDILGINDDTKVPPYGSAVAIEVRRKNEEYFVKIKHKDKTDGEFQERHLNGCEDFCPWISFKQLTEYVRPSISVEEACLIK